MLGKFMTIQFFLKRIKNRNYKIIITSNFDSRIYNVCDGLAPSKYIDYFTISSKSGCAKPTKVLYEIFEKFKL